MARAHNHCAACGEARAYRNAGGRPQRSNPKVEISNLNVAFSGESPTAWQGLYGIQIYRTSGVTLRNISATNGNAGILINGSEVALEGTVDVSGNTFGGIELSKGSGVTETPSLSGAVASIKNTTEAPLKPPSGQTARMCPQAASI